MKTRLLPLTALAAAAVIAGCGSSDSPPGALSLSASQTRTALAGSPAPLAGLHGQANRILGGGSAALDRRIRALHGYPVVINFWGSWCGPCRDEFPYFQQAALKLGKRVAFVGVDVQDAPEAAAKFLRGVPVTYPSYADPAKKIAAEYGLLGTPSTAFYDASGHRTFLHQGPYRSVADLEDDIHRYAGA